MKKIIKISLCVISFVVISLVSYCFITKITIIDIDKNFNNKFNNVPISEFHKSEFNIVSSNYIEDNYNRYLVYRSKHTDYTDDQVITYVNIGLDYNFYTNINDSDSNDGILILCNKYNRLSEDYVPKTVAASSKYAVNDIYIVSEAYEAFKKMSDDAKSLGYNVIISSGYRSYSLQNRLYDGYVERKGKTQADLCSARPGYSEHQTGLAIDVYNKVVSYSNFGDTKEFTWMKDNSYKYGWILRYTSENQWITGYKSEPWHYRYVGVDVATYIYEHGISFEEYYATFLEN